MPLQKNDANWSNGIINFIPQKKRFFGTAGIYFYTAENFWKMRVVKKTSMCFIKQYWGRVHFRRFRLSKDHLAAVPPARYWPVSRHHYGVRRQPGYDSFSYLRERDPSMQAYWLAPPHDPTAGHSRSYSTPILPYCWQHSWYDDQAAGTCWVQALSNKLVTSPPEEGVGTGVQPPVTWSV